MPKHHPDADEKRREISRRAHLAEQGVAAAQDAVAATLAQGYFVKKNLAGALYWYAQAMKQGYTHAKWNAGTMLVAGEGVESVRVELGMQLIEQAAADGSASACGFLSQCYAQGMFGKTPDTQLSTAWAHRARDHTRFVEYGRPFDIEAQGVTLVRPNIEWS